MIILRKKATFLLMGLFLFGTFAVSINNDKLFEIAKNLEIFTNVYRELNTHYVDELDPNVVMKTAIDAVMDKLDPYTVYYSESQIESSRISLDEKYSGLGASSMSTPAGVTLKEVYKDGPADKAGLKAGDRIVRINGASTEGKTYEEVLQYLRGFPGSSVKLTVQRPMTTSNLDVALTRAEVDMPNVPYFGMLNDHIGYINLTTFTREASRNIGNALRTLKSENDLKGVVLDLRDNGGGLLSEAIDILGLFLPKETLVVSTRGKVKDRDQEYKTRLLPIDTELPLVILINKYSASASEIVSGSIQDYDRGVILGQRSYGKGLVQNFKDVGYNSQIKVTISKYYVPSGRCIQSVAYVNGEPKDIPDDQRAVFYTKNRRPVLDGGGVTPDVRLDEPHTPEILKALNDQHILFDFVTEYVHKNPVPSSIDSLRFEQYDEFITFAKSKKFEYQTKAEEALSGLQKSLSENPLRETNGSITSITKAIATDKADDLQQFKDHIIREIELDLAARYYYQEGKTRQNLRTDKEVNEAITLLLQPAEYHSLLKPK